MYSIILPLITFVFAASFTPGPNNIMLTASGVNYGFRRTVPHISGIVFGMPVMVMAIGIGLGQIFTVYPQLHEFLKWAGSAYLLYLAWKIFNAGGPGKVDGNANPLTFTQAALFQWVNPKGWVAVVAALTNFSTGPENYMAETIMVATVFFFGALGSTMAWTYFGALIGRWLKSPMALRIFNTTMAALIVGSIALLYL